VIVSHDAWLVASQLQPPVVVRIDVWAPPAGGAVTVSGETLNVHEAPACATVIVWPATVSVPVRAEVSVFAEKENATVSLPRPFAPAVIASQEALLVDSQLHPSAVVTPVLPEPAIDPVFSEAGATV